MQEIIIAHGHENVLSTNSMTIEFTKEEHLTKRGDCIVAVSADKGCADLSEDFKEALKDDNTLLEITITAGDKTERILAHGSKDLILTHPTDMVIRKSTFVCPRTLAIRADKAAAGLSREFVGNVATSNSDVRIILRIMNTT